MVKWRRHSRRKNSLCERAMKEDVKFWNWSLHSMGKMTHGFWSLGLRGALVDLFVPMCDGKLLRNFKEA